MKLIKTLICLVVIIGIIGGLCYYFNVFDIVKNVYLNDEDVLLCVGIMDESENVHTVSEMTGMGAKLLLYELNKATWTDSEQGIENLYKNVGNNGMVLGIFILNSLQENDMYVFNTSMGIIEHNGQVTCLSGFDKILVNLYFQ